MKQAAKLRSRSLHAVLGMTLGLPLFVMFWAGAFALFDAELQPWLHPAVPVGELRPEALDRAAAEIHARHPDADTVGIATSDAAHGGVRANLYSPQDAGMVVYRVHPTTGDLTDWPELDFAGFLVELHYFHFFPGGQELSGLVSGLLCALILAGALYQWGKIRDDLRWPDARGDQPKFYRQWHRHLSALTLPFQLVYATTGAALGLGLLLVVPGVHLFLGGDSNRLTAVADPSRTVVAPSSAAIPRVSEQFEDARRIWAGAVEIQGARLHFGHDDEGSTVTVFGMEKSPGMLRRHFRSYDASGTLLAEGTSRDGIAPALLAATGTLHFATFGPMWPKVVFFVGSLLVSLGIGAGLSIWLRREVARGKRGAKLLHAACAAMFGGLPAATAAGFLGSLFRAEIGIPVFWWTLLATSIFAVIRRADSAQTFLLRSGAILWFSCPLARAFQAGAWKAEVVIPGLAAIALGGILLLIASKSPHPA